MKYKIVKKQSKSLRVIKGPGTANQIEVSTRTWYEGKRKGCIFGFWHAIGHEAYFDGELIPYTANTVEEMEDYINKFHEVEFSKYPMEIIKEVNL